MVVVEAAHHVHVDARYEGLARRGCAIVSDAVRNKFSDGIPVANYESAETPFLAQDLLQREWIGSRGHSIQRVERAHQRCRAGFDCRAKRRQVILPQSML